MILQHNNQRRLERITEVIQRKINVYGDSERKQSNCSFFLKDSHHYRLDSLRRPIIPDKYAKGPNGSRSTGESPPLPGLLDIFASVGNRTSALAIQIEQQVTEPFYAPLANFRFNK